MFLNDYILELSNAVLQGRCGVLYLSVYRCKYTANVPLSVLEPGVLEQVHALQLSLKFHCEAAGLCFMMAEGDVFLLYCFAFLM